MSSRVFRSDIGSNVRLRALLSRVCAFSTKCDTILCVFRSNIPTIFLLHRPVLIPFHQLKRMIENDKKSVFEMSLKLAIASIESSKDIHGEKHAGITD